MMQERAWRGGYPAEQRATDDAGASVARRGSRRAASDRWRRRAIVTRTYRTIDADGHVAEPADLWERYIDPAFRDTAPRLVTDPDGAERILVEDTERVFPTGLGTATSFGKKPSGPYASGRR